MPLGQTKDAPNWVKSVNIEIFSSRADFGPVMPVTVQLSVRL